MGGQRIYILSLTNKWNVVGVYTNIRQVRKSVLILNLENLDNVFLQEIRMNQSPKENFGKDAKYMLIDKIKVMDKVEAEKLAKQTQELTLV